MEEGKSKEQMTTITVIEGGPYLVEGGCVLINKDGFKSVKKGSIELCRCGHSKHKPYCDDSHENVVFDD